MDEPTTINQDGSANQTSIEDRIAAIIGQRNSAQGEAEQLRTQNQELGSRLTSLEATIRGLIGGQTAPREPAAGDLSTLATSGTPKPASTARAQSDDMAGLVQDAVSKALQPIYERFAANDKQAALNISHQRSYNEAVNLLPDLIDRESELSKAASRILESRADLLQLPDAPMLVAQIAKGIISDQRRSDKQTTDRKRQAAIPSQTTRVTPNLLQTTEGDGLKEYADRVTSEILSREATTTDLGNMFRAELSKQMAGARE